MNLWIMKIKALLTLTFITLQSSHAGQVSYSWLHPVSVLSYFPQTGGKSTFHGLTYRWQSSLTPGCHLSAILVILNQPSSAKVIIGKHLVCTHTIWHAKAVQEFSFAIHLVRIWFPISLSAMPAAEKLVWVIGSTVLEQISSLCFPKITHLDLVI